MGRAPVEPEAQVTDALRHWLWANFGWDCYEWHPEDVRF